MQVKTALCITAILWTASPAVCDQETTKVPDGNTSVNTGSSLEVNSSQVETSVSSTKQPVSVLNEFCYSEDVNRTYGYKITIVKYKNRKTGERFRLYFTQEFRKCEKDKYNPDQVVDHGNGSVTISNKTYDCFNHVVLDNVTYICKDPSKKSLKAEHYLAYVCQGISILCLLLHLANFSRSPQLRNLPGWNLASLCVALLLVYATSLIGELPLSTTDSCYTISLITYYSFLAAFFWMNVISFDIMRAMYLAAVKLRVPPSQFPVKRFAVYSTYSWGLPVVGLIIADAYDKHGLNSSYRPMFGTNLCWFNNDESLMVFFAIPVIVLLTANVICFSLSFYFICNRKRSRLTAVQRRSLMVDFILYTKLAVIMGMTWIFGIISRYVHEDYIMYTYLVLNSLQGFFIFIAFSCGKIIGHLFSSLRNKIRRLSTSSQNSTTTDC